MPGDLNSSGEKNAMSSYTINKKDIDIRLISKNDSADFFRLIAKNRKHLSLYFPKTLSAVYNVASAEKFIDLKISEALKKDGFWFLVIDASSRQMIGSVVIKDPDISVPKCELAWFIDQDHEGQGITSKAAQWVVRYCFQELGMEKILARINPSNHGSKAIALKNGFIKEGYLKNEYRNGHGVLTDVEYYGLIKDHYQHI